MKEMIEAQEKSLHKHIDLVLGCEKQSSSSVFVLYSSYLRQVSYILGFLSEILLGKHAYK